MSFCPVCGGTNFMDYNSEVLCVTCRIVIEFAEASLDSHLNSGTEKVNIGNSHISGLLPDLSGSLRIEGFGNGTAKRMYRWNYVNYFEKSITNFYKKTLDAITYYELKNFFRKSGIPVEGSWKLYDYQKYVDMNGLEVPVVNKKVVEKTMNIYKLMYHSDEGKKNFCHREKNKMGVISTIYYYINKEYDILVEKSQLAEMFGITKETVKEGNNRINKVLKKNPGLRKYINKVPFTLDDLLVKLQVKFPTMTDVEFQLIKIYAKRIKGTVIYYKSSPKSILAGILVNLLKMYQFSITETEVREKFDLSASTLNKYEKKVKNLF